MANYNKGAFLLLVLLIKLSFINGNINKKHRGNENDFDFVDYIEKYDIKHVMDRVQVAQKLRGYNLSESESIDAIFYEMDATDDLLNIKVQNGNTRMTVHKSGRRWSPPRGLDFTTRDHFGLRPRLFELMKQAIYQARNKMTIMQQARANYRNLSLYKMGFLMSKTDNACKTFSKFAFRAFKICELAAREKVRRVYLYDILVCNERLLSLWFTVDLLVDLLKKNDANAKKVIEKYDLERRLRQWKFID